MPRTPQTDLPSVPSCVRARSVQRLHACYVAALLYPGLTWCLLLVSALGSEPWVCMTCKYKLDVMHERNANPDLIVVSDCPAFACHCYA